MKVKEGLVLRTVAGEHVVLPVGGTLDLNVMVTLNGTGAFLWERLERQTDAQALTAALLEEYDVDDETAQKSVAAFLEKLRGHGFLEE